MSPQRAIPQTWQEIVGRGLLAVAVFVVYLAAGSSPAHAGTYFAAQCHSTANPYGDVEAVYTTNTGGYTPHRCGSGTWGTDIVINRGFGCACVEYGEWTFAAPTGTVFRNISLAWIENTDSCCTTYPHNVIIGASPGSGWSAQELNQNRSGTSNWNFLDGANVKYLIGEVWCGGVPGCGGIAFVGMWDMSFELSDLSSPTTPTIGGELGAVGVHRGTETLTVHSTDKGGGVYEGFVRVNGSEVSRQALSCAWGGGGYATDFTPCPRTGDFAFNVNTETAPWHNGDNALETCVDDLAESNTPNTTCDRRTVTVDNACTDSSSSASSLQAGLKRKNGTLEKGLQVNSTDGATLEGTLGAGAAGGTICVYETLDAPGQPRQLSQTVRSKTGGGFAAELPSGPSRAVDVVYRYNNKILEDHLKLDSAAVPELRFKKRKLHNGQNMRFSGSIPAPLADGRAVTVQARVGKQWRTFKQLSTDLHGNFAGLYKFKHSTLARATYRFRVLIKKQSGYPYEAGQSKVKKVVVVS